MIFVRNSTLKTLIGSEVEAEVGAKACGPSLLVIRRPLVHGERSHQNMTGRWPESP